MKSENGFTYPLTLMVFLIFLTFFTYKVEELSIKRKLGHETSTILKEEYYFLSSVNKLVKQYQSGSAIPTKGSILFTKGTMGYQTEKPIGTVQKINFTLRLNSGETILSNGYFDISSKRLVKWVELK